MDGENYVVTYAVAKPMRRSRASALILAVCLLAVLTGCSLFYEQHVSWPTHAELVGSWVHAGPNGAVTKLQLDGDGSLEVQGVPREVFTLVGQRYYSTGGHLNWNQLINLAGTWSLSKTTVADLPAIDISAGPEGKSGGITTTMIVQGEGQGRTLSILVGDPDNQDLFSFSRK